MDYYRESGFDDELQYYTVANVTQGFINNTEITVNMQMQRISAAVGTSAFANSGYTDITEREEFNYYSYKGSNTQFSMTTYDINQVNPLGAKYAYQTFNIQLTPNTIFQTIDLNRGIVGALALFGGFMGAVWLVSELFVTLFDRFEAEKGFVNDLTVFSGDTTNLASKKEQTVAIVTTQQLNSTNFVDRVHGCCCSCLCRKKHVKQETFCEAREKVEAEMDLAQMIQTVRMAKFLRQLNEDNGHFSPLIAYQSQFRLEAAGFPVKAEDAKILFDNSLADGLNGSNNLQRTLAAKITGSTVGRVENLV